MTDYVPPVQDILFAMRELAGLDSVLRAERFSDFDADTVEQVVAEAGKFAAEVLAPINIPGDQIGCEVVDGKVVTPSSFDDAYRQYVDNGWQSVVVSPEFGGMGMPDLVGVAVTEVCQAACLSFTLAPMLTAGAALAIEAHASESIKNTYLPLMASGKWSGTMNLTEPQAGSDLAAVTTRATADGDAYRVSGSKIFITWGDQEITENVVHLVLARLADAPDGVHGLSLFLVPKYKVNADGSIGERNDVQVASVEHKLGIHGSPTCVMNFGEKEGAVGYLVGEENKGLACMFTMMNHARIDVGVQGLAISDRAYQLATAYALDRKQGRAPGKEGPVSIVNHADVRRMLLLMKSQIEAMRGVAYSTAANQDAMHYSDDATMRENAARRHALVTPIMKGWMTETAQELTSLGVQIHGGMGYVEETGAAQHMRDARILTIYEGTTGIQASDFVGRKIIADDGYAMSQLIADIREFDSAASGVESLVFIRHSLRDAVGHLQAAVDCLLEQAATDPHAAGSASVSLLMLAGVVLGGWHMARAAAVCTEDGQSDVAFAEAKKMTATFYAAHVLPRAASLRQVATAGSDVLMALPEDRF